MTSNASHSGIPELTRDARVYIAGHRGLVGSAVWRHLESAGFTDLVGATSAELDLRDAAAVADYFESTRPSVVVDAAARVGGIVANNTYPADFISENLRIQVNLIDNSTRVGVDRFLFLGSSCVYPKFAPQPIQESSLLTGILEPTNDAYAIAKIAGILQIQAVRRQFGRHYVSAMPTNLYGTGDNFHPTNSHVLPGMLRRFHEAKRDGLREVVCWGSGTPLREFLHVDDLAVACRFLLESYDAPEPINVGTGSEISTKDLAHLIADVVGYDGEIVWDTTKPDGTPRKVMDVSRIRALGWQPLIDLREGIETTYAWFVENQDRFRT
jgi:Nucleoside-diphosphate-sugar epimerases